MSSRSTLPLLLLLGAGLLALGASRPFSFRLPVRKGTIRSKFGSRDNVFGEGTEFHNGIDIALPEGTKVYSIAPGIISSSYITDKGGKQLVILHDNGYRSGYAHLRFPLVKTGDRVEAGSLIAESGKTGKVTGAHLHFTLKNPEGKYVDPERYLRPIPS